MKPAPLERYQRILHLLHEQYSEILDELVPDLELAWLFTISAIYYEIQRPI